MRLFIVVDKYVYSVIALNICTQTAYFYKLLLANAHRAHAHITHAHRTHATTLAYPKIWKMAETNFAKFTFICNICTFEIFKHGALCTTARHTGGYIRFSDTQFVQFVCVISACFAFVNASIILLLIALTQFLENDLFLVVCSQ